MLLLGKTSNSFPCMAGENIKERQNETAKDRNTNLEDYT